MENSQSTTIIRSTAGVQDFIIDQMETVTDSEMDDAKKHKVLQGYIGGLTRILGLELAHKRIAIQSPEAIEKMVGRPVMIGKPAAA